MNCRNIPRYGPTQCIPGNVLSSRRRTETSKIVVVCFRPHSQLPELLKAIPYPPPAVLQTSLPIQTTVTPVPQYSTIIPESTKIMLPVLPETVPLIAQVPDVVATASTQQEKDNPKEIVEISQVLPGYARSYAVDYVPNEVKKGFLNVCSDFL